MPIRSIKPAWAKDEKMLTATPAARAMSVCLIVGADNYGCGRGNPDLLAAEYFPFNQQEGKSAFAELLRMGFCRLYRVRGQLYYSLTNWERHQLIKHLGKRQVPAPPWTSEEIHPDSEEISPDSEEISCLYMEYGIWKKECDVISPGANFPRGIPPHPPVAATASTCETGDGPTKGEGEAKPRTRGRPKAEVHPDTLALVEYLNEAIASHRPSLRRTNGQLVTWCKQVPLAFWESHALGEVKRAIDYAHRSEAGAFWRANLLSPAKVVKHTDTILVKLGENGAETIAERNARIEAEDRRILEGAKRGA